MSADSNVRRLLPQSSQMQSFSFAPNNFGPRENQKNYVFVDEHNRHKRLKVMRACEGCRRRKIKCDAATTNTWPCSACIRLKLHCVPPTVNYDRDFQGASQGFESERVEYESGSGDDEYQNQIALQQHLAGAQKNHQQVYQQHMPYTDNVGVYQSVPYAQPPGQQTMQFNPMHAGPGIIENHYSVPQNVFPVASMQQQQPQQHQAPLPPIEGSPESYHQDPYAPQDLADYLGDLKMDARGSAPYLSNKSKITQVEEPAFEDLDEYKNALPPVMTGPDMKIRIPPELMPDEETCLHYFDMFFTNVHPYVPVLNKTAFYHQWHTNRETISPLILEAIFAISGRLADEPSQGQQWLALASKHADSFMDVPRLSTLQAMLLILKARESAPKRGYYYRSWMTVVQCVAMGKDLGLDEHFEEHKSGKSCGSNLNDCITKTRIWQTIFSVELMIGSPQGRTDLAVSMESLDLGVPRAMPGEDVEFHITRNFTYFTRVVKNVRRMNFVYSKIRRKKDWGMDPELTSLNPSFESWMNDLPSDLQITFPSDGTPPWLPSHFIGNLHSYYYLSIIMLHRPQLQFLQPTGVDGGAWKQHMLICYSAAKQLCKIQEAILQYFGMPGLLCMQRGINYTIYCILTCVCLHLVCLTSPDPDLNNDAREYFERHMRILEKCTSSWPMPDMQQQIDALREAFSADMRKPFVLKPTFPYGSPAGPIHASPPRVQQYHQPQLVRTSSVEHAGLEQHIQQAPQVSYLNHPITPPISAGGVDSKSDSPAVQSLVMMASGQRVTQQQQPMTTSVPMVDPSAWNPSRIFDQWNTTFGGTPTTTASANPTTVLRLDSPTGPQPHELQPHPQGHSSSLPELQPQNLTHTQAHPQSSHSTQSSQNPNTSPNSNIPLPQGSQAQLSVQQYSSAPIPSFVSPSMWQESVASVYEGGLKRQWDFDGMVAGGQVSKRPR